MNSPMPSAAPLIILDHIRFSRGGKCILEDVRLKVNPGEHWAILGPNGSGKTTLLTLITAYSWPTRGTVTVLGGRYGTVDVQEKRRRIGMVSSALFERVPPRETLFDVVLSGRYGSLGIYEKPRETDLSRAAEIVDFLDCGAISGRPYGVLSFGERQRALIGRALMPEPRILILDEPCEGLDIHARENILSRLDFLMRVPDGPALLLVTHRIEEIPPGITHALVMKNGRVLAAGLKLATVTSPILTEAMGIGIEVLRRNERMYAVVG
jgi:iron complex transport system ATP-binding protein